MRCGYHTCCRPLFSSPIFTLPNTFPNLGCPSRNQKQFLYTGSTPLPICKFSHLSIHFFTYNKQPLNDLSSFPTIFFPIYKNAYIRFQKFSGNKFSSLVFPKSSTSVPIYSLFLPFIYKKRRTLDLKGVRLIVKLYLVYYLPSITTLSPSVIGVSSMTTPTPASAN